MFILLRNIGLTALALALGYLLWLGEEEQGADEDQADTSSQQQPDLYGKNVQFHQLNPDGSLHYRLNASRIEQYLEQEFTDMIEPQLHLVSAHQPPWDIDSELGSITTMIRTEGGREDVVVLRNDVQMVQTHPDNGVMTLRSEAFSLFPDRQYAETDQDVIIDTAVGRTVAAGMTADLDTGVLVLSSDESQRVHTIVLPEQFKKS